MRNIIFKFLLLLLFTSISHSQSMLKIEDAIAIGLKNNFDIQISRNEADIDKVNNTPGNAGMYPNLSLNMGGIYNLDNSHQEYINGSVINNSSTLARNYNAGLALNWTLFDGFKMFTTRQKLQEIQNLGELKYRYQIQQSVAQIVSAYYDIVRQKQQLKNIIEVKELSRERMKIGETRFNAGMSAKTELLQAQVDFNTQSQSEILQINVIAEAKRNLYKLINLNIADNYEVTDSIPLSMIDSSSASKKVIDNNPNIKLLQKQLDIARLSIQETESLNLPYLNLTAGYGLNIAQNSLNSMSYDREYGPQVGLSFSLPIYQGGNISRKIEVAELSAKSIQLDIEALKIESLTQFQNALNRYGTQLQLLAIEEETKKLSKENLYLAMERLKLAQTTSIEVRDAQLSYENSITRLSNIYFNLKVAETEIKLLAGEL